MADKKISELDAITGANTAADDYFIVVDTSGSATKKISRAELNNAIEKDVLSSLQPGIAIEGSSSSDALRITQTGTGNALVVEDSANPDSTPAVIDSSGIVIVGHTEKIQHSTTFPQVQTHTIGSPTNSITSWASSSADPARFILAKSRSGTIGTRGVLTSGTYIGLIRFMGDDGTSFLDAAAIGAYADGTPGTNDMPGRLVFSTTADGASSPTERMRIDSSGRVGIGTGSPASRLTVSDGSSGLTPFSDTDVFMDSNGSNYLQFGSGSSSSPAIYFGDSADGDAGGIIYSHATDAMSFRANAAERMHIDSSGRVGIGTTSPVVLLDIGPTDGANEGAEVKLRGATNSTVDWGTDVYISDYRIFTTAKGSTGSFTERFRITSGGNVGIGTSSPSKTLDVDGQLRIRNGGATGYALLEYGASATATNNWHVGSEGDGTYRFYNGNFGAGAERMRITSSGRVGIGTSSPAFPLDVQCDTAAFGLQLRGRSADDISVLRFRNNAADTTYFQLDIRANGSNLNTVANAPMLFFTNNTERMRIDSSGNVGIGTSSPGTYRLNVQDSTDSVGTAYFFNNGINAWGIEIGSFTAASETDLVLTSNSVIGSQNSLTFAAETGGYWRWMTGATSHKTGTAGASEVMRIDSSGNLLIGQSTDTSPGFNDTNTGGAWSSGGTSLHLSRDSNAVAWFNRNTTTGTIQSFRYNGSAVGSISVTASATAYNTSSDYRLKENVVAIDAAIDRVKLLKPSRFNFIVDPDTTVDGFVAHEVSDIVPEAVHGAKDAVDADGNPEYQGIDQSKLVPVLTAALQEAISKIEALEARVAALETA